MTPHSEEIANAEKEIKRLNEYILSLRIKEADIILSELDEVKAFIVVGYTPDYNDGEPCEHIEFLLYGKNEIEDENFENRFDYSISDDITYRNRYIVETVFSDICRRKYEDNYEVIYEKVNGKWKYQANDYNCGY